MPEEVASRSDPVTIGLIAARVAVLVVTIRQGLSGPISDDLARFREIFLSAGAPYRSFPVEYAPGELVFIRVFGSASPTTFAVRLAIIAFVADLATWTAIRWAWGRTPATTYLLLGAPLLIFIYLRFDLVPVAIAAWAAALVVRGRERSGGIAFALAIATKLWPLVVAPILVVQRRRQALIYGAATTAAVIAAWVTISGVDAVRQVATFRGARGWGVESSVGSVVWIVTGGPVTLEQGSPRVGYVPMWAVLASSLVLFAILVAIWFRASARPAEAPGAASLAAVGALLAFSPLFSLQYAAWLLPWAAIASISGHRALVRLTGAITVLTAVLFVVYDPARVGWSQAFLIARNGAVLALPVLWLASGTRGHRLPAQP